MGLLGLRGCAGRRAVCVGDGGVGPCGWRPGDVVVMAVTMVEMEVRVGVIAVVVVVVIVVVVVLVEWWWR